ncbi:MAG: hypothetical protein JOZ57_17675, partial [Abitibacteriaceae bacterium]|nr:hypothetical protein [Abditibacteriaceae bacterium]
MPETGAKDTITVAPGQTQEVTLKVNDQATKKFELTAQVTSPDGKVSYFDRTLTWQPVSEDKPWVYTAAKKEAPPVDFNFAYYPYLNRMRIAADVSNLPKQARVQSVQALIRKKAGAAVKTVTFNDLKEGRQELSFTLPPLQGQYEIALSVTGQNVPTGELVKEFERTVYPWEHKNLGKRTKVYAPFTPIRIRGKQLSTILRDHTVNNVGLWDQVVAKGEPLLAAPMSWSVSVDGDSVPVQPERFRFLKTADNTATAQGGFTAGALHAQADTTWDYDGTMRLDLHLQPTAGKTVNALTLDIPLNESEATHLHAMGDGIRNTLYQKIPAGTGSIWNAKSVQASDLPQNFCTYIYVGTPVRGLCWFAENDKGWGWDAQTPNLELVREPGRVILRVHLINQPQAIATPRTITFGLLAAPVKPRIPLDWRHKWRRDQYTLLGTDINWLALGDAASVYPAGKDMYLWEMIKRGNREHLSDADINSVIERGKPYFAPYGADVVQTFINHVRYNLTSRYGKKMIFYYNRASYQAADEFETFKDEWALKDLRTVGKGIKRDEIKIVPSESYIDHALYWYGKSFDIGGNQGVYWDNWFFAGSYNTMMTGAYQKSDGTVVPSTGIWGLRELSKRTFQYLNERGMFPFTMPHMTSTSILPMLSFATVQYDWEWKYSEGDVQDRFTRDYIQL